MHRAYVYADLPRAGLGNMLLVWAKACAFAYINGLPMFASSWTQLRLGPLLRRERSTRLYAGYFRRLRKPSILRRWWICTTYPRVIEPAVAPIGCDHAERRLYLFDEIPHWSDYFGAIRQYRNVVRSELYAMLSDRCRQRLTEQPTPVIGIHVRLGDFRLLRPGEDFAKVGQVRTPLTYFVELVTGIRQIGGDGLTVTIFSDGHDEELAPLLRLPYVTRAPNNPVVVDLLLLSQSKVLVASASSTFSAWGAFLADAPALLHPDHIHQRLRPEEANAKYFEGGVHGPPSTWPPLLVDNLKALC